jgi:hypothetical protein
LKSMIIHHEELIHLCVVTFSETAHILDLWIRSL